jgi:hypothetical protein
LAARHQRAGCLDRARGRDSERTFGAAACDARYDRARNGSQADHPLHPAYITKTEAAIAWIVGKNWKKQIRVRGRYKPSTALTSLAERPVFSLRRREFFPTATG